MHFPPQNEPLKNPPRSRLKAPNTLLHFGEYFKDVLHRQMSMMVSFVEIVNSVPQKSSTISVSLDPEHSSHTYIQLSSFKELWPLHLMFSLPKLLLFHRFENIFHLQFFRSYDETFIQFLKNLPMLPSQSVSSFTFLNLFYIYLFRPGFCLARTLNRCLVLTIRGLMAKV